MKIAIGGDHAGFPLKGPLIERLKAWGHEVTDHGCYTPDPVDFPDIAQVICEQLRDGKADRAIMVCGTGVGAAIACNKMPGVCRQSFWTKETVKRERSSSSLPGM